MSWKYLRVAILYLFFGVSAWGLTRLLQNSHSIPGVGKQVVPDLIGLLYALTFLAPSIVLFITLFFTRTRRVIVIQRVMLIAPWVFLPIVIVHFMLYF